MKRITQLRRLNRKTKGTYYGQVLADAYGKPGFKRLLKKLMAERKGKGGYDEDNKTL